MFVRTRIALRKHEWTENHLNVSKRCFNSKNVKKRKKLVRNYVFGPQRNKLLPRSFYFKFKTSDYFIENKQRTSFTKKVELSKRFRFSLCTMVRNTCAFCQLNKTIFSFLLLHEILSHASFHLARLHYCWKWYKNFDKLNLRVACSYLRENNMQCGMWDSLWSKPNIWWMM